MNLKKTDVKKDEQVAQLATELEMVNMKKKDMKKLKMIDVKKRDMKKALLYSCTYQCYSTTKYFIQLDKQTLKS